jgi:uncharacterized membrane protein YkoI
MRLTTSLAGLIAGLALTAAPLGAMDKDHQTMDDKNAKTLQDVPLSVRDTLMKEASGQEISKVNKKQVEGQTVYEAKIKHDGSDVQLRVNPEGKVIWRSDQSSGSQSGSWTEETKKTAKDVEKSITGDRLSIDEVPAEVRETFKREAAGNAISDINRSSKDGKTVYEGDIKRADGSEHQLTVSEDGKILKGAE